MEEAGDRNRNLISRSGGAERETLGEIIPAVCITASPRQNENQKNANQ